MTERPITFPQTAEGAWTNSETGVRIEAVGHAGYRAFRPADVTGGYIGICRPVKTLAEARHAAKRYVADAARFEIARAYVEAVAEHAERAERAALVAVAEQSSITWERDRGTRNSVITSYAGTTAAGITYHVESTDEWDAAASRYRRVFRTFRAVDGGRRHPAAEGGPLKTRAAAYAQAEADLADVLASARDEVGAAYDEAVREDAERLVAKDGADALIHHWANATGTDGDGMSDCGVDLAVVPYTFGSPRWSEVTCKPCVAARASRTEADTYPRLCEEPTRAPFVDSAHSEALAEDRKRYGISVGDLVVFADPEDIGIDTERVWRVSAVHAVGTIHAYADLAGHGFDMVSASYFDRLAPAPQCTRHTDWLGEHEFEYHPAEVKASMAGNDGYDEWERCGKLRGDEVHNTDRERAERTIYAARDHAGTATGTPYGGEWPGTTDVRDPLDAQPGACRCKLAGGRAHLAVDCADPAVPADVRDDAAWSEYAAALPAPTPEALAEVAVEHSTWTAQRRVAVEAFRSTARTIWSLRVEGLALPGSREYKILRASMRHFRELTEICDRQNDALRRELTHA